MDGAFRVQLCEAGADAERLDTLAGFLRNELLQLDVKDVTALRAGDVPPDARAFDVAAVGGLLVSLGQSAEGLQAVLSRYNDLVAFKLYHAVLACRTIGFSGRWRALSLSAGEPMMGPAFARVEGGLLFALVRLFRV